MSMTDPIADMLTRIRNAQMTERQATVEMPSSKVRSRSPGPQGRGLHRRLQASAAEAGKPVLEIALRYHAGRPVIERIERVSSPGLRIYRGKGRIPRVMNGLGIAIVSTSRGVMTDHKARPPASAAKSSASSN